ncbi:hypothetical protein SAMN04487939_11661 [Lysobacter sp. yr284]|uniref:hypothetical protein n=1 Tax=Lysobacter TaxID=68 RepID=UPI00089609FB|nr:hypothetical protein [Lysobacter sp. yr284]SDZ11118.1 hypothetical protein SAMN04487939_11661 [Lysobacter sp. yr284]
MSRRTLAFCAFLIAALLAADAAAKNKVTRQLGGACGEDANTIAQCDVGMSCKDGYCAMNSYLSEASRSCKDLMVKAGVVGARETVSVHDGFCYKHCDGMYELAMQATPVTERLMHRARVGSKEFGEEVAKLSDSEKATFKAAESKCNSCGKQCTIGSSFLGRGGY